MGDDHPLPGRVEPEVSWDLAFCRCVLDQREATGGGITGKDGDGVVGAIRDIDDLAIRVGHGFCRAETFLAAICLWQRRDGGDLSERALFRVIGKGGDGHEHLVVYKGVAPAGMKREMTRPTARCDGGETMRADFTCCWVELIHEHLVEPQITGETKATVRTDIETVRMRSGLALRIHAAALVLDEAPGLAQTTIFKDLITGDTAAAVVRDGRHFPAGIDGDVTRPIATGGDLIDALQAAIRLGDRKSADAAALHPRRAHLADGIQIIFGRMNRQETGAASLSGQIRLAEFSRGGIKQGMMDAFAA